jgi:micrococcal nuclease
VSLAHFLKAPSKLFIATMMSISLFGSSKLFETANDIPADYFQNRKSIESLVMSVSDGDTYRVRHIMKKGDEKYTGDMKHHTIVVRIAAVDTPETAKGGNPGQPYAQEAKQFATDKLLRQRVRVKLLARDQYGRVIGRVFFKEPKSTSMFGWVGRFFGGGNNNNQESDISEELLKSGLAVVYRQGGARYDGSIEHWNTLETQAQRNKLGMWQHGIQQVQTPGDYKKQVKAASTTKVNNKNKENTNKIKTKNFENVNL